MSDTPAKPARVVRPADFEAVRADNNSLYLDLWTAITEAGATPQDLTPEVRRRITANDTERWGEFFAALDNGGRIPERPSPIRLDTLTMIRRLQGQPDPLRIEIAELTRGPYVGEDLPRFAVWLTHTEGEREPFSFFDMRPAETGTRLGWEVEFHKPIGRQIITGGYGGGRTPMIFGRPSMVAMTAGMVLGTWGISGAGAIPPGIDELTELSPRRIEDVQPSKLALSPYVALPGPGTYEVRLRFEPLCPDYGGSRIPPVVCMSDFHTFEWHPAQKGSEPRH